MLLDQCPAPIALAPMAGGPSTPELCAAVADAGGLGFLAAGYLSTDELGARIERTRALTDRPFGVNLFVPPPAGQSTAVESYRSRLAAETERYGIPLGEPRRDDDAWDAKLDLVVEAGVAAVSLTFGCPDEDVVRRLHAAAAEVWVTVTTPTEAREASRAGADCLVVQGTEAGGHRGGFVDDHDGIGLLTLLLLVRAETSLPLVAAGGIMSGAGLAAALVAGARAGSLGTAFLRSPEAGTAQVHREALAAAASPTSLTRAFSGRLARGIRNRFLDEHGSAAPAAYPEVHHLTAPLRAHGRATGDAGVVNLWAGQGYPLGTDRPAAEVVELVSAEALEALAAAPALL